MDKLSMSLKHLCSSMGDGSFETRAARSTGLQAMAKELRLLGIILPSAHNLKGRHVEMLVAYWKGNRISDQTIRNRLVWVRDWTQAIGKPGVLPRGNGSFGLAKRGANSVNRAKSLTPDMAESIDDERIRMALRLQEAFGLRREEVLKMRPAMAHRGRQLALKASWCKGGRYREVPILTTEQRQLLIEVKAMVGSGALIGEGMNYKQAQKRYDNLVTRSGIGNGHGFRYQYAQRRYRTLTGWACPLAGGPTCDTLTIAQRHRDRSARMTISNELGHDRIDVTDKYLGRRWAVRETRGAVA